MRGGFFGHPIATLAVVGFLAGGVNGLLGAGGGMIIVFALSKAFPKMFEGENDVFSTALCVMLPVSALSAFIYTSRGSVSFDGFGVFIIPAVVGGALGGMLLGQLRSRTVNRLFASLCTLSGMILIVR